MARTIKFLSQYFYPEAGATSELLSGIAAQLSAAGYRIEAVAGPPSYFGSGTVPRRLQYAGVRIRRVWATSHNRNRVAGRILNTITFVLSTFWDVLWTPADTLLIAVTNPPLLPWVCLAGRLLRHHRYVILVHDVYPDIAVRLGAIRPGSLIARLWSWLNRLAFRHASRVVVLGRDMEGVIAESMGAERRDRIVIIPNWADGRQIHPIDRDHHTVLASLQAADRFVVQYSGNIGRFHEIETILGAARQLEGEGFLFLFIGTGAQVSKVEQRASDDRTGSVRLLPFQPRARLGTTLTACDIGLVTLRDGLSGLAVPSKLYGILAAGKPVVVIGPDDCEAARVVAENRCGMVARPADVAGLTRALTHLRDSPDQCRAMGQRAREAFEAHYDLPAVVQQWRHLIGAVELEYRQSGGSAACELL